MPHLNNQTSNLGGTFSTAAKTNIEQKVTRYYGLAFPFDPEQYKMVSAKCPSAMHALYIKEIKYFLKEYNIEMNTYHPLHTLPNRLLTLNPVQLHPGNRDFNQLYKDHSSPINSSYQLFTEGLIYIASLRNLTYDALREKFMREIIRDRLENDADFKERAIFCAVHGILPVCVTDDEIDDKILPDLGTRKNGDGNNMLGIIILEEAQEYCKKNQIDIMKVVDAKKQYEKLQEILQSKLGGHNSTHDLLLSQITNAAAKYPPQTGKDGDINDELATQQLSNEPMVQTEQDAQKQSSNQNPATQPVSSPAALRHYSIPNQYPMVAFHQSAPQSQSRQPLNIWFDNQQQRYVVERHNGANLRLIFNQNGALERSLYRNHTDMEWQVGYRQNADDLFTDLIQEAGRDYNFSNVGLYVLQQCQNNNVPSFGS